MGRVRVGIGGWTFPDWRGLFYPPGLPHARELAYAAERFTAIEINATFYKRQNPDIFSRWAAATPDDLLFALKASRFCTNRRVLADAGEAVAGFFAQGLTRLGPKLGPILWQFPDTKRFEKDDFSAFLDLLPAEYERVPLRHVVEVGHPSFDDPAFVALVRAHGVAVARIDPAKLPPVESGGFTYARLQGMRDEQETGYDALALDGWADTARGWAVGGDAFVFMINGAKRRAPAAAEALLARLRS